jgi:kinase-associated protein B
MADHSFSNGDIVRAVYRAGEYIGEIVEVKATKAVVKIVAVQKHPTQGDLHNPFEANVPMFHQRRALAFQEKALVPLSTVHPYEGEVPSYNDSLQRALADEMEELNKRKDDPWAQRSLEELDKLKKEYFPEA